MAQTSDDVLMALDSDFLSVLTSPFQSTRGFGSPPASAALRLPQGQSPPEALEYFGTGLTAGSIISAPVTGIGGSGIWCAPYYVSNLAENAALLGSVSPLFCPLGTDKEIKVELGFLRRDEFLAMATCARMGSAPSITFILTASEEQKSGSPRLVGMALRPNCADIAWRGTSGQVRRGSLLEQRLVARNMLCPSRRSPNIFLGSLR